MNCYFKIHKGTKLLSLERFDGVYILNILYCEIIFNFNCKKLDDIVQQIVNNRKIVDTYTAKK